MTNEEILELVMDNDEGLVIPVIEAMNLARKDEAEGFAEWAAKEGWTFDSFYGKVWFKPFETKGYTTAELYIEYINSLK